MVSVAQPSGSEKVLLLFCVICLVSGTSQSNLDAKSILNTLQHAQAVEAKNIEALNFGKLTIVYYFVQEPTGQTLNFLVLFDDAAQYLKAYDVLLAAVDCDGSPSTVDRCEGESSMVAYRDGIYLLTLDIDTMFDVDSVMANSLQLLLLREAQIIRSKKERDEEVTTPARGNQDVIFFYTRGLGTTEHRIFMEIAYAYQGYYRFAVSTVFASTDGLSDRETVKSNCKYALWTLHCSRSPVDLPEVSDCPSVLYRGTITLSTLAKYMDLLPEPNLYYAPENGTSFEMEGELPVIFIYTNSALKKHSDEISFSLAYDVKGFAKVVVLDVDNEDCYKFASDQGFNGNVPQIAITIPDGNLTFLGQGKPDYLSRQEIHHFLDTAATIPTKPGEEIVTGTDFLDPEFLDIIHEVKEQDDEVAKAVFKTTALAPEITNVPSVLKATFQEIIQDAELKVVLYYLPHDAISMAFLTDFDKAARILNSDQTTKDVLAVVNCYDATDVCARENVTTYPVIRIHRRGSPYQAYDGPLDLDAIVRAVALLKYNFPLTLEDESQLDKFRAGDFPVKVKDLTPSSVVFVAHEEDLGSWAVFRESAKRLAPFVALAEIQGSLVDVLRKNHGCPPPCVLSFHHNDVIEPVKRMSDVTAAGVDDVIAFVKQAMIPTMPELTADNFPALRSKNVPFVILFLNESSPKSSQMKAVITDIALLEPFHESVFCWMNVQNETMGMVLLNEYTRGVTTPTIAVVDHKQAKVFTRQTKSSDSEGIVQWLVNVFNGEEKPSKFLEEKKWSPPGPHYDFLKMIDEFQEASTVGGEQSGYKIGMEKEEEVRQKLLALHHSGTRLEAGEGMGSSDQTAQTEAQENEGIHHHEHDHAEL